jgi:predicted Zn-dependent protease
MTTPTATAARSPAPRLRRWGAAAAVLGVLALGGILGWRWFQDRDERREALQLAGEGRFDAVQPLLRSVFERHPEDVAVVRALALGHLDARQFDEAQTFLDRWCELRPEDSEPYRRRLDLWMKQQKVQQAVADAGSILRLEPNDFQTRQLLVQLLLLDGRFEQAEKEGLRCFKAQPNNVDLWYLLASIYHGQRRDAEAADLVDRLLRVKPDSTAGLRLRAELYLDAGQPDPAIRLLKEAAAAPGPEGLSALYQLSLTLSRAGRDEEGKKVLVEMQWRQALDLWSTDEHRDDNSGLQARVVEAMLAAGKADEAVRFLTDILGRKPDASGAHRLLADCYEKMGQPERAAEHRRRARP